MLQEKNYSSYYIISSYISYIYLIFIFFLKKEGFFCSYIVYYYYSMIYFKKLYINSMEIFSQFNIETCMKIGGEIFSLLKRGRRCTMYNTFKLSGKRTPVGQNSGKFFNKHRRGNFYHQLKEKSLRYKDRVGILNPFLFCLFYF